MKTVGSGVQREYVEAFPKNTFEFEEARIVGSDKRAGIGVMAGLGGPGGKGLMDTRNLYGEKGWGIISNKDGLDGGWWRSSAWLQIHHHWMAKEKGMEHLVNEGWPMYKFGVIEGW